MENAWVWAKANKKLFTSEVHGEEFISVDVENFRRRVNEEGQRMEMGSGEQFEVGVPLCLLFCYMWSGYEWWGFA